MGDLGNRFDDAAGKAKEGAGKLTGDEPLQAEGKLDQAKSGLKDKAEDAKDAAKDKAEEAIGKIKGSLG